VSRIILRERAGRALKRLPPLSVAASNFLAALRERDVEPAYLAAIIQRDPMLAPNVLLLANSGVFGRLGQIGCIKHAVCMVGASTLRRYALRWTIGGLLKGFPDLPHWSTTKFTMHAEAVALLSDTLCDHLPVAHADSAFVAGLIHDIGKFVICAEAAGHIEVIMSLREKDHLSAIEAEREVLGIDHAELSDMAAQYWRLPDELCQAILCHHQPSCYTSTGELPLSLVLSKADGFVNGLGLSFLSSPLDSTEALEWPGYERGVQEALESFAQALQNTGHEGIDASGARVA